MSTKSDLIYKLKNNKKTRVSYLRAKINVNVPSQIKGLRLRRKMKQEELARDAEMKQPRISAMECPGATKFNLETLIRLAAAFKVGLVVKFVPFSEMLRWENNFSQDTFNVLPIDRDVEFQERKGELSAFQLPLKVTLPSGAPIPLQELMDYRRDKGVEIGGFIEGEPKIIQPGSVGEKLECNNILPSPKQALDRPPEILNVLLSSTGSQRTPLPTN